MDGSNEPRLAYSIEKASEISGVGRTKIYEQIKAKRLIARKCDDRTLILHPDLVRWLTDLPRL